MTLDLHDLTRPDDLSQASTVGERRPLQRNLAMMVMNEASNTSVRKGFGSFLAGSGNSEERANNTAIRTVKLPIEWTFF